MPFTQENIISNNTPANELASQSTQQSQPPVCTWSACALRPGSSPLPFLRTGFKLAVTSNAAGESFLLAGNPYGCENGDVYMFSTRDFSTTLLKTSGEVPTPRYAHSAALIGTTTLLIYGGITKTGVNDRDSLYLLNLETREWSRVVVNGSGPGCRYNHITSVVGSKLFIFGIMGGMRFINDMWALDLNCLKSQPVWELCESTPGNEKPLPRWNHVSVTTGDHIIIFGGSGNRLYYNDTWSFDISTRKWTELQCTGSIPSPRSSHVAAFVDGVMYVFGGFTGEIYLDDLFALQLSTLRWFKFHSVGQSPHGRSAHAMVSDETRVFVLGGYSRDERPDEISLVHFFDTEDIEYPEPERLAVNPTQKLSTGFSIQEPLQHPAPSSPDAHGASRMQKARPDISGRTASLEITHERNPSPDGWPLEHTVVRDPEDGVREGSTEYQAKFSAPHSSSEGEATRLGPERQLSARLSVQTERDHHIAELVDELVQSKIKSTEAKLDELLLSFDQRNGRLVDELVTVRAKLEAKETELEVVRSQLTDAEKGWAKSKAEADELRAQTAMGSANRDEDQLIRRLMERMRAIEGEVPSKRWNEKSIEEMECRNEG